MKIIFLIMIWITLIDAKYIRDDLKDVVIDTNKKLMWQDDVIPSEINWSNAVSYCENLKLSTFNDWRLPKVEELNSIVKVSVFKNRVSTYYWSSTNFVGGNMFAWHVRFSDGYVNINVKKDKDNVRCVR